MVIVVQGPWDIEKEAQQLQHYLFPRTTLDHNVALDGVASEIGRDLIITVEIKGK